MGNKATIVDNHVYTSKDSWKMIEEVKEKEIIEDHSIAF